MKKVLIFICIFYSGLSYEPVKNVCYKFRNETSRQVSLEFHYITSDGIYVTQFDRYERNGQGELAKECVIEEGVVGPVAAIGFDSIVVDFERDRRRLIYLIRELPTPRIFHSDNYSREGDTFTYSITEEDLTMPSPIDDSRINFCERSEALKTKPY